jgi:hypothetical protein
VHLSSCVKNKEEKDLLEQRQQQQLVRKLLHKKADLYGK